PGIIRHQITNTQATCPHQAWRPWRAPPPARLTWSPGGSWRGRSPGPAANAPVPVVPAPPDGSGDELRHPAHGRAAGTLDIRRPPKPLTPYLDPGRTASSES